MGYVERIVDDEPAPGRPYAVLVAVANPASVEQLMRMLSTSRPARTGRSGS